MPRNLAWMLTQDLAGVIVVGGLAWLGKGFLQTVGGGVALLLVGAHAGVLRRRMRPGHDRLLLFATQHAYTLLALNAISGLAGQVGDSSWAFELALSVLVFVGAVVLLASALIFLPPTKTSVPSPLWRDRLWKQLTIVLPLALFFRFLSPLIPVASISDPYVLPGVAALACSVYVAALMVRRVPRGEPGSEISAAMRKLVVGSPVWVALGSFAEILRGSWVVWIASAAAVLCAAFWTWLLASRSPLSGITADGQGSCVVHPAKPG